MNTVTGALAELWISNVPENGNSLATPTRLLALNGLSPSCSATSTTCTTSYLPTTARTVSPAATNYHNAASFTVYVPDTCAGSAVASGVSDYQLNYLPSVNPTEAAGYNWVIFSSRRMYGNVAYGHPWDAEPGTVCEASTTPSTKKLWVAAVDKDWTPGTDPSHPAFYLPGQELLAGNSNAYWINAACTPVGGLCSTHDDCCGATGNPQDVTTECKVVSTATVPATKRCSSLSSCSGAGAACTTSGDCCTGLTCPDGGGTCLSIPVPIFETQTFEREYVMTCPSSSSVKWRFFEWQATLPTGTSIDFAVQTKQAAGDVYAPATPLPLATATSSTPAGVWVHGASTTEEVLASADLSSRDHLLVRMTFNPDAGGMVAPTLNGWRQIYDCVPAQ